MVVSVLHKSRDEVVGDIGQPLLKLLYALFQVTDSFVCGDFFERHHASIPSLYMRKKSAGNRKSKNAFQQSLVLAVLVPPTSRTVAVKLVRDRITMEGVRDAILRFRGNGERGPVCSLYFLELRHVAIEEEPNRVSVHLLRTNRHSDYLAPFGEKNRAASFAQASSAS
jgi:hypothetical protein